jgi:hypothetical protein
VRKEKCTFRDIISSHCIKTRLTNVHLLMHRNDASYGYRNVRRDVRTELASRRPHLLHMGPMTLHVPRAHRGAPPHHAHAGEPNNYNRRLLQMCPIATCETPRSTLQYLDKTLTTYIRNN